MPTPIRILVDGIELEGELDDSAIAQVVAGHLPLEDAVRTFGQAFYMETPVDEELEPDASDRVAVGDIAYWPPALAVTFFFGPTPESAPGSEEPVAASDVAVIGRFRDGERLNGLASPERIRVEHRDDPRKAPAER